MDIEQNSQQSQTQSVKQELIMQGAFFYHENDQSVEVRLVLTNKYIRLFDINAEQCLEPIQINYDTSYKIFMHIGFQNIYELQINGNQGILKLMTLRNLDQWDRVLIKYIARAQFHQLFKSYEKLGKGNFASVYKGTRMTDQKIFAIKAFSKKAVNESGRQGLENQISLLRKLNHQNLCGLEGVYTSENSIYLVIEYIEGQNLQYFLNKPLVHEQRVRMMKGILAGLAQLSRLNIVHRDLKPQNIMIDIKTGQAKIIDFGLSTFTDIQKYLYVRCGTPGFVAPQIIRIQDTSRARMNSIADVFSAGCIYYHLIFNTPLFTSKTNNQVTAQNKQCKFQIPDHCKNITVSQQQICLLRKMLEINPEFRISASQALELQPFTELSHMRDEQQDYQKSVTNTVATSVFSSKISNQSSMCSSRVSNMQPSIVKYAYHNKNIVNSKRIRKGSEQTYANKQNINNF